MKCVLHVRKNVRTNKRMYERTYAAEFSPSFLSNVYRKAAYFRGPPNRFCLQNWKKKPVEETCGGGLNLETFNELYSVYS